MSGVKSDYFIDKTTSVVEIGNWYNQSLSKKYKLNGLLDGFVSYENWDNSLLTFGGTFSLVYNNWLSFPVTYTVYDYGKTANQEVFEGYIQIRY